MQFTCEHVTLRQEKPKGRTSSVKPKEKKIQLLLTPMMFTPAPGVRVRQISHNAHESIIGTVSAEPMRRDGNPDVKCKVDNGDQKMFVFTLHASGREVWFEFKMTIDPLDGRCCYVVGRDITDRIERQRLEELRTHKTTGTELPLGVTSDHAVTTHNTTHMVFPGVSQSGEQSVPSRVMSIQGLSRGRPGVSGVSPGMPGKRPGPRPPRGPADHASRESCPRLHRVPP